MKEAAKNKVSNIQRQSGSFFNPRAKDSFFPSNTSVSKQTMEEVQAKLTVGEPGDKYEKQADEVADRVVNKKESVNIQGENVGTGFVSEKPTMLKSSLLQKSSSEEYLQSQELDEQAESDKVDRKIQAKDGEGTPPSGFESQLESTKGSGTAMDDATRSEMEGGFNNDFSDVKIHTGTDAAQMSEGIGAQAFTHGNDIYFNEGKYNPGTSEGKHLLAHELTHTVQQGGGVNKKSNIINPGKESKTKESGSPSGELTRPDFYEDKKKGYSLDTTKKEIVIPTLKVPDFKKKFGPEGAFTIKSKKDLLTKDEEEGVSNETPGQKDRPNDQVQVWMKELESKDSKGFIDKLDQKVDNEKAPKFTSGGKRIYYFQLVKSKESIIFGQIQEVRERLFRPYWDGAGSYLGYDVDHKRELQLGGENLIDNMWLLESSSNRSSGSLIKGQRVQNINNVLKDAKAKGMKNLPSEEDVRKEYTMNITQGLVGGLSVKGSKKTWELDQIQKATHLNGLKALKEKDVNDLGLRGSVDQLVLYKGATGGLKYEIDWGEEANNKGIKEFKKPIPFGKKGVSTLKINKVLYGPKASQNALICTAFPPEKGDKHELIQTATDLALKIEKNDAVEFGGIIPRTSVAEAIKNLSLIKMSPINITDIDLDENGGLVGRGKVLPSIPLIKDADIEILFLGDEIQLRKTFNGGEIKVPPPFKITDTSLAVFISSTKGFGIEGQADFEIQQVGQGFIKAAVSQNEGFALEGEFNFDSKLFDPAKINVAYKNGEFSVSGIIGIKPGKVKGVKSATITAAYSKNVFTAEGQATFEFPGIESGNLSVLIDEQKYSIGGKFKLKNDIPGIKDGEVEVTITKMKDQEGYDFSASGKAKPKIPGINSELFISYKNGALTIEGQAEYARGMLSGKLKAGATNAAIDDKGQPTGKVNDSFVFYGGGTLTLKLCPWLQATAGVEFLPNGELKVKGEIGLPSAVDIFPRYGIPEKEIFGLGFDIPIFAIPVGPKSIGLKATIRGGFKAYAGIGPGKLDNLKLGIEYNPDHEDETKVYGSGRFVVPADAGLNMFVRATIGLNALIGGVEGGLEISAGVGLQAEASAGVNINWSPKTGVVLDALLAASIQPKFKFNIDGVIEAWVLWYEKEWRWSLLAFEYGPNMKFGLKLPVHYEEGKPFNISFDDIQFEKPQIDVMDFLKGLIKAIREERK